MNCNRRPRYATVQSLEPRRLLSGTIATLTGSPFEGTVGTTNGVATADLTILVASESKSGKIVGTFTETSNGNVSTRNFTGTVNSRGKVVLHIKKQVHAHFVIHPETATGTVTPDGNTLAGTTNSGGFRGTFSATRVTT